MSSALRRCALPTALLALALGASGCLGDDEEDSGITLPSVPATTQENVTTLTTPTTATEPTTPKAKPVDPNQPDTPENDVPPPSGSPQERFEEFCKQNPEACG